MGTTTFKAWRKRWCTMLLRAVVPCLLSLLALAGCSGGEDPEPASDPLRLSEQVPTEGGPLAVLRFAGAAAAVHEVVWANGTVAPQQACNLGGCITGTEGAFHRTVLTDRLPPGTPTLLSVSLQWTNAPIEFGSFDVLLEAPESTVYGSRATIEPGRIEAIAVLRPSGPVAIIMAAWGPGGEVPTTAYTLRIGIDSDPEAVLPGVPVAIPLEAGNTLQASSYGGGEASFLLYGPDDAFLGQFDGERTLPDGARAGDYVVILPAGGPSGNLSTDSGADRMRALALRSEPGADVKAPPTGAGSADWTVGGVPVALGFTVRSGEDLVITPMMAASELTVRLVGPGGYVLDGGEVCGLCLTGGYGYRRDSGTGDPLLTAGAFRVEVESQLAQGAIVQPYAVYLDRSE